MVKIKEQRKFLKKPTVKSMQGISSTKTLKSFSQSAGPVVREIEQAEIVQDNRSQFFKRELEKEERGINKWLS